MVGILTILPGLSSCSAPQEGAGIARSPESQSIAEYDVARDLWLSRGQRREALTRVLKAIELDDENYEAEHLASLIFLDFCKLGNAECQLNSVEAHARRALDLRPEFLEARNTLGVALLHQERAAEAVDVLQPLTQNILYKTPENAWGNLGWAYMKLDKPKQAVDALERSVSAQPQFCVGFYRLGLAQEALGQNGEARASFTQALEVSEGRCKGLQAAYAGRARVAGALELNDSALVDLKTCIQLDKTTDSGRECSVLLAQLNSRGTTESHAPPLSTLPATP